MRNGSSLIVLALLGAAGTAGVARADFVNWESPHVNPIDLTPDGTRLLVVNTADNRLEVFAVDGGALAPIGAVPVGLDPVSVRARSDGEAWVVNHVSDSVSVVDLDAMGVVATIATGDEPADVVFAGDPQRAFVSVSQLNQVAVYDPDDPAAAPLIVAIQGEDPRALATDGTTVWAAIFESGNRTTILGQTTVSSAVNPYPGDQNPPPNDGAGFEPPIAGGLPAPPDVSLIVKKDAAGIWRDDNGGDWSAAVGWDLHDHDLAAIDAGSLAVSYVTGAMNANMNLAARPGGGVLVVGTDAVNEIRFEPNVQGIFVRVIGAVVAAPGGTPDLIGDLNPHLDYSTPTVPQGLRDESIGDPRGVAWDAAGDRAYVTGMGSNNLVVLDAALSRLDRVEVGEGPTGIVLDEGAGVAYVLNKFAGSISVVDLDGLVELGQVGFFDPTPDAIKTGRPHLYDTHETSGLGQASCASCHIDGRMDQVAWDLGNPAGSVKAFDQTCQSFLIGSCENWHPMKGPMTTQTLIGIIGTEPFHWRGDRTGLEEFNPAFEGLMGDDEQLTAEEMDEFIDFVATLKPQPNPFRNANNSLPTFVPEAGGNALSGSNLFLNVNLDAGALTCNFCHAQPSGTSGDITPAASILETQSMKIPQLRNMFEKTGFDDAASDNNRGFGFTHDGAVDSIFEFLQFPGFTFANDQQRRDVDAFLLCFSTDTHAGTGRQVTVGGPGPDQTAARDELVTIMLGGGVRVIAKGVIDGEARGFYFPGFGEWVSDRAGETWTLAELDAAAAISPITYTLVPPASMVRMGVDRDRDGAFDRDELDACSDPADPDDLPGPGGCADIDGDGVVDVNDLILVILGWGACPDAPQPCDADVTGDGAVDVDDLIAVVLAWG